MSKAPTIAPELADLPHVPVSALVPLQGDLKQLSEREYNKLRKSLTENGVIVPFFVWLETGKLLDGHQRQRVFLREGWECDVPVVYISADDEADAKRKLLVISSQYGKVTQEGWDEFTFDLDDDWLAGTVQFDALPFVFEGWQDDAAVDDDPQNAEAQTSRAEELREQWGVDLGQMWRLPSRTEGQEHRLICGDCTDADVVARVMGGEVAEICFTSPPYNLGKNISISNRSKSLKEKGTVYESGPDDLSSSNYLRLLNGFTKNALQFSKYLFCNIQQLAGNKIEIIEWLFNHRQNFADVSIWHKTNQQPAMAENVMNSSFEYIFILSAESNPKRAIKTGEFRGTLSNVYTSTINKNAYADIHGAAFPLEFAEHYIKHFSRLAVLEMFSGVGTTIIAAENLSRQCRAVEISPAYVAVALQRYQDAFGITPELING